MPQHANPPTLVASILAPLIAGRDDFDHIMTVAGYAAASSLKGGSLDISTLSVKVLSDTNGGKYDPLYAVEIRRKS